MVFVAATFNVNSVRSRLHVLEKWIASRDPDLLLLQETKVRDEDFPASFFERLGYAVYHRGMKSYNGVAVVHRRGLVLEDAGCGFDGVFEDERDEDCCRFVHGRLLLDGLALSVLNVYVPQGRDRDSEHFERKLAWLDALLRYLELRHSPAEPLLLAGDFNIAPGPADVHDPRRLEGHVCFCPQVRERFAALLEWGLEDVFRRFEKDGGHYTFFDYRVRSAVERGVGWRVDHILCTPPLAEKALWCRIDLDPRRWEKPSDHTFLVSGFDIPSTRG